MESFSLCALPPCCSSKSNFSALPIKKVISFTHCIQKKHFSTGIQLKMAEPLDRYIVDVMNQLRVLMWNCFQHITQQKNQEHEWKRKILISWELGGTGYAEVQRAVKTVWELKQPEAGSWRSVSLVGLELCQLTQLHLVETKALLQTTANYFKIHTLIVLQRRFSEKDTFRHG